MKKKQTIHDLRIKLAGFLLHIKEGERLPSIRELARATHMSLGSVSTALNDLQEMGVVKIQNRGHLGSIVTDLSLGKLWNAVEQGPIVVALTLPMHNRFEGLATGVKAAFEKFGIETYLIYIRGSSTRLKALKQNRCHVAVMSGLAAERHCDPDEEVVMELPAGSWISQYCIFYRTLKPEHDAPLRIAVDRDSSDQILLSSLVFAGQKTELVYGPYVKIPRLLKNNEVDATVWAVDQADSYLGSGVQSHPIAPEVLNQIGTKSTSAAFVMIKGNDVLKAVIQSAIIPEEIMKIQDKVSAGEMIPSY